MIVIFLLGTVPVFFYLGYRFAKATLEELSPAPRVRDGFVLRQARSTEHFCRPPDTQHEVEEDLGWEKKERGIHLDILVPKDKWTPGDVWVCDCGIGWKISTSFGSWAAWVRSPEDDL